jgi:putative RecB family exonuclease
VTTTTELATPAAGPRATYPSGSRPASPAGSLSPSRAADFLTCALLYRFRVVDRLPEPPSEAATRGTLVHAALERLFDLPAEQRTPAAATALLGPEWARMAVDFPELTALAGDDEDGWLAPARALVGAYFDLEDPTRLEPADRELYVEATLDSGLVLRGVIDRLDATPGGALRISDYKSSRSPREAFEQRAMFQLRCYGLLLWRSRGVIPRVLQLLYLGDRVVLRYSPTEADLLATERKLGALWQAVQRAHATGDWRPRPSRLCDRCAHRALCPAWGGTPPPLPPVEELVPSEGPPPSPAGGGAHRGG